MEALQQTLAHAPSAQILVAKALIVAVALLLYANAK
jgi:hypothetical protein